MLKKLKYKRKKNFLKKLYKMFDKIFMVCYYVKAVNKIVGLIPAHYGGVAQLVEHLPCKQGVRSSTLLISTIIWAHSSAG